MSTTNEPTRTPRTRRRGRLAPMEASVSVAMPAELRARLEAASERYGVAVGAVARTAIEVGMRGALDRLRAAARRQSGRDADGEAGK